jgi:hypothetical protein
MVLSLPASSGAKVAATPSASSQEKKRPSSPLAGKNEEESLKKARSPL